jgi:sterol desaturase/sphingolipid hydroxylase (fatty acid hydroxylase superfamily)
MDQLVVWVTVFYIVAIVFESFLSTYEGLHLYDWRDSLVNILMGSGNFLLDLGMKAITFFVLNWFHQFAFFEITSPFWSWFTVILLQDFAYYWLHRVDHSCRFFWAIHVNHHSSEKFNFTVAIRSSLLQPLYRFVYYIPVALMGFDAIQIMVAYSICQIYGFFIHTETIGKLGPLEWIFATPSNHRVHHGSNPQYLDKNLGMFLIIWDRIFGTYAKEEDKVVYGLTRNINTKHLPTVVFHEWNSIISDVKKPVKFKDKLMYIFGPPGWSHDGTRQTSQQIRKSYFKSARLHLSNSNDSQTS